MTISLARARAVTRTTHTIFVDAPPWTVYRLVADVSGWPHLFSQVAHAERIPGGGGDERLRVWTFGHGAVRRSTSRRSLDPHALRIQFHNEDPVPPVASMVGVWIFVPLPDDATSAVLLHEFRAVGDDPAAVALIEQAVDRTSTAELTALKTAAELADRLPELVHGFRESIVVRAEPDRVYDVLHRADEWPGRVPHVTRLVMDESVPNVQTVEMDAESAGSAATTRLLRLCFPPHTIVYKQTDPPPQQQAHVGAWQLRPAAEGVTVTASNTVMLRPDRIGELARRAAAGERIAEVLGQQLRQNCLAILEHAKRTAENRTPAP